MTVRPNKLINVNNAAAEETGAEDNTVRTQIDSYSRTVKVRKIFLIQNLTMYKYRKIPLISN